MAPPVCTWWAGQNLVDVATLDRRRARSNSCCWADTPAQRSKGTNSSSPGWDGCTSIERSVCGVPRRHGTDGAAIVWGAIHVARRAENAVLVLPDDGTTERV